MLRLLAGGALSLLAFPLQAQVSQAPVNDLPNPYRTVEGWAKMPEGRTWGSTSAVDIDRDGTSIWVAERCGVNNCLTSKLDPVLKFDASGSLVKSFGAGLVISPHAIFVDRESNVWVVDCACTAGRVDTLAPGRGHQVHKFSADGQLLMTLGKAGGGREPEFFYQPNDILVAPNGDIYISEGHSSAAGSNARVVKLDKTGKLLASWGKFGTGPLEFDQPHTLAMDSQGRLFVGDRGNNRIQILSQQGKLLDTWYQFSRPSGISIDRNDNIYVADSESGSVSRDPKTREKNRTEWKRGLRIGSLKDGKVTAFVPDPAENPPSTSSAEGVAVDANGVIYGAEVGQKALKRYEKK